MTLCLCLDDRNGLRFHDRRQSRDRTVYERIVSLAAENGGKIWVSRDSEKLFPNGTVSVAESAESLSDAAERDIVFSESTSFLPPKEKIGRLIVYRWNRLYPSDCRFSPEEYGLSVCERQDFVGFSHEKITEEIYQ